MKERFCKIWKLIKRPPAWIAAVVWIGTLLCATGAILLAILPRQTLLLQVLSYAVYALSAIVLSYAVYLTVLFFPRLKKWGKERAERIDFCRKLMEQYGFRTVVTSAFSMCLNVAYVVLHILLAFLTDAFFWYLSLATYYGVLVALRAVVVLYQRRKGKTVEEDVALQKQTELKKYRLCGILLAVLPVCLTIPMLQIFYLDRAFVKEEITVIAFAAYAFYKITMAIIGVVRAKKQEDYTLRALRSVSLADALVSIFSLQTALLFLFGNGIGYAAANAATGGAVCLLTTALGILMIVRAHKEQEKKDE